MTTTLRDLRVLDEAIAEHVLGWIREDVPAGSSMSAGFPFPRSDCALFREHKNGMIEYSTDFGAHSNNDRFFRNGKDGSCGYARPIPHFVGEEPEDIESAWLVVAHLTSSPIQFSFRLTYEVTCSKWIARFGSSPAALAEYPALAIGVAALNVAVEGGRLCAKRINSKEICYCKECRK